MPDHNQGLFRERAFWDSQMAFSRILPDFQECLARMEKDSADFSHERSFERLDTGGHPRQWVEWTEGSGRGSILPVTIHGGYWRALRAEDHRFMMRGFSIFGERVANIEYRLMPEFRLSDCASDVKSGLLALAESFPESRLLAIGHSAGAHLAVRSADDPKLAKSLLGVIALSGVFDLRPVALSSLQDEILLSEEEIEDFSLWPSRSRVPVLYVNGSLETHEFLRGSALMSRSGTAERLIIPDVHHLTLTWAACERAAELVASVERRFNRREREPEAESKTKAGAKSTGNR